MYLQCKKNLFGRYETIAVNMECALVEIMYCIYVYCNKYSGMEYPL